VNCPNCGTNNLDNATVCANCGRSLSAGAQSYTPPPPVSPGYGPGPGATPGMNIPNYLWQSIVVTLCCCLPLGIVGIIFATQVNSKLAQGDTAGALEASRKAKLFTLLGLGIGLVFIIISFVFNGAMIMNAVREAQANR
jgi:hypothetical protein